MQNSRVAKRILMEKKQIEENPIQGVTIEAENPADLWKIYFHGPKVIKI